jgi:hypothetical protein
VFMIWRPARLASCLKFVSAQTYRGQPIRIKADIIVLNNWCACMKHSGRRHVVAWGEAWQTKAPPPQKKAPALRHLYAQIDSRRVEFGGRARANSGPLEPEPDARWTGRRRRASQKSCRSMWARKCERNSCGQFLVKRITRRERMRVGSNWPDWEQAQPSKQGSNAKRLCQRKLASSQLKNSRRIFVRDD